MNAVIRCVCVLTRGRGESALRVKTEHVYTDIDTHMVMLRSGSPVFWGALVVFLVLLVALYACCKCVVCRRPATSGDKDSDDGQSVTMDEGRRRVALARLRGYHQAFTSSTHVPAQSV